MDNQNGAVAPEQTAGTQAPANPSAPSPEAGSQQPASPASNGVQQAPVQTDWRNSPEFRGIAKENRRYKEQLANYERKLAELEGRYAGFSQGQGRGQSSISQEDATALERITQLMLEHPRTMQMFQEKLGTGKIGELEKGLNDLSQSWYSSQADSERALVLEDAKKIGLDPEEVSAELDRVIEEDPWYADKNYRPGSFKKIYRDITYDKAGEFRERAINQETIKKREALKGGAVQSPNSQVGASKGLSPDERFQKLHQESGGFDFTR